MKFTSYESAKNFHYKMNQYSKYSIILGEYFEIVTNREALKLAKQGFEIVC